MTKIAVYVDGHFHEEAAFESVPRIGEIVYSQGDYYDVVDVWHVIDGSSQIQTEIDIISTGKVRVRS